MQCPLCRREAHRIELFPVPRRGLLARDVSDSRQEQGALFNCLNCGGFAFTNSDLASLRKDGAGLNGEDSSRLQVLLRERYVQKLAAVWLQLRPANQYWPLWGGEVNPEIADNVEAVQIREFLNRWPRSVTGVFDRVLRNLAQLSPVMGAGVLVTADDEPLLFARDRNESSFIIKTLQERRWIEPAEMNCQRLTATGWARLDEIERSGSSQNNPGFVAMWFGNDRNRAEMDAVFTQLEIGARRAGYLCTRVDREEHDEYIMDKVLGLIRKAPFLIADFTGQRRGVYYESAFAEGLGIPVIHTCKRKHFERAHFDTKQINHILWDAPEELLERIKNRLLARLGPGPHEGS